MPFPLQRLLLENKRSEPVKALGVSGNVRPSQFFSSCTEKKKKKQTNSFSFSHVTNQERQRQSKNQALKNQLPSFFAH